MNYSTESIERIEFHLTRVSDRRSVHSYRKVDDLHDGTYLFRYRLYESVENLHIYIRFGRFDLEHIVKGHLYSDGCYCPETNRTEWFNALECSSSNFIRDELKKFNEIDMRQVISKAKEKYFQHPNTFALCHYAIKSNRVSQSLICLDKKNYFS